MRASFTICKTNENLNETFSSDQSWEAADEEQEEEFLWVSKRGFSSEEDGI